MQASAPMASDVPPASKALTQLALRLLWREHCTNAAIVTTMPHNNFIVYMCVYSTHSTQFNYSTFTLSIHTQALILTIDGLSRQTRDKNAINCQPGVCDTLQKLHGNFEATGVNIFFHQFKSFPLFLRGHPILGILESCLKVLHGILSKNE
jgi:hypothetical protein